MLLDAEDDLEVVAEAGDGAAPTSAPYGETHRSHIQQKLGLSSRAELVRYALDNDLIER